MIRAALILLMLGAVGVAAAWFAEYPGRVAVYWSGWHIDTSISAAALGLAALVALSAMVYRLWAWLRAGPRRLAATRETMRRRRGYRALTQSMVAVAAGDGAEAMRLSQSAEALLKDPPLTLLLSAQSAQLQGDERAAEKYFRAMLGNPELEFLGLRGLLSQSLRANDNAAALEFAHRAYALKPQTEWAQTTLFELQMASGQWKRAEALLQNMGRNSTLTAAQADNHRAILLYEQARAAQSAGDTRPATRLAVKAHGVAPGFVPASVLAAKALAKAGNQKKAQAVIAAAWRAAPHPDLVDAFRGMWPGDSAEKRLERFAQMVGGGAVNSDLPGFAETKFGLARLAADARDWVAAREHLTAITADQPSARVCRLWAEIEDGENGPSLAARDWLMKAANATNDPAWVCDVCSHVAPKWSASCPHCHTFDSLEWQASGGPPIQALALASARAPVATGPGPIGAPSETLATTASELSTQPPPATPPQHEAPVQSPEIAEHPVPPDVPVPGSAGREQKM